MGKMILIAEILYDAENLEDCRDIIVQRCKYKGRVIQDDSMYSLLQLQGKKSFYHKCIYSQVRAHNMEHIFSCG